MWGASADERDIGYEVVDIKVSVPLLYRMHVRMREVYAMR
jgi:hypothetical protein